MSKPYDVMPTVKISPEAKQWVDDNRHGMPITKFINAMFDEIIANYDVTTKDGKTELIRRLNRKEGK